MTTRTFKQYGQAYGSVPASITATIDGVQVFSGPVYTVDEPLPTDSTLIVGSTLFNWTNTVDFAGTQSFSISVTGSPLRLTTTVANYRYIFPYPPTFELPADSGNFVVPDADSLINDYAFFYIANIDGIQIEDPFTNVVIDGVPRQRGPNNADLPGQWQWIIPAGSTFTATLNITAGSESIPDTLIQAGTGSTP
jgi:hypothetical protein